MVQANKGYPSRKCFQQQFDGFARFAADHEDAWLYVHAWEGTEHNGQNLSAMARALGIRDRVIGMDPYLGLVGMPEALMAQLYRAADVTLNATAGEGFGVPIIESLACGVPVIVTDFSAMKELCPPEVGWRVGTSDRFYTGLDAFQVWPDPEQIAAALRAAHRADREAMADRCVTFARQFDVERVVSAWLALLEDAAAGARAATSRGPAAPGDPTDVSDDGTGVGNSRRDPGDGT